eukprot:6358136-Prymnesium_polylepis.1
MWVMPVVRCGQHRPSSAQGHLTANEGGGDCRNCQGSVIVASLGGRCFVQGRGRWGGSTRAAPL